MSDQGNASSDKAASRAVRIEQRLNDAKATVAGLRDLRGDVGLAWPNVDVPKMTDKGDFHWRASHLPINGEILTDVVAARLKEGTVRDPDVVRYKGGEIVRAADGKFPTVVLPTVVKWNHPILIEASHKSLMAEKGRQFLADPHSVAMLHNTVRDIKGSERVNMKVHGVEALVRNGSNGPFVAFAAKKDLYERMDKNPRVAPYLAAAVVQLNSQYVEQVLQTAKKQAKDTGRDM